LDIKKLRILRKKAIDEYLEIYSEEETDEILEELSEKGIEGKYIPFCKAIEFVLVGN